MQAQVNGKIFGRQTRLSVQKQSITTSARPCRGATFRPCTGSSASERRMSQRSAAAAAESAQTEGQNQQAVAVLKEAAVSGGMPASRVFNALWQLEKLKAQDESWDERLGSGKGGRRWRLVFTAGAKDVSKGSKTGEGSGFYFPVTAVQRWEKESSEIENGIYLGQLAAFTFRGPYEYAKKKLSFDFTKLSLRLGPKWFRFDIKSSKKGKQGPFFLFFYVDEEIACARGKGGGYAIWHRTTPEWDLKAGVTL